MSFIDRGATVTTTRMEWDDSGIRIDMEISPPQEYRYYLIDIIIGHDLKFTLDTNDAEVDGAVLDWPSMPGNRSWKDGEELKIRIREHLLSGLRVVDLGSIEPVDFLGRKVVGIGSPWMGDGEVHMVDLDTGEWTQLTSDGHRKSDAAMSTDYLAWIDQRRQVQVKNSAGPYLGSEDVFIRDLRTGEERLITEEPARRSDLQLSGSLLLWQENRHGDGDYWDIYAYDLESRKKKPLRRSVPRPAIARMIDGDVVVWTDRRVYMYDFSTGEERPLVGMFSYATISGRKVRWEDAEGIVELDINAGPRRTILERAKYEVQGQSAYGGSPYQDSLVWSDNHVVWTMFAGCDLLPHPVGAGVFLYDLRTDRIRQLSIYTSSRVWLHDDVLVVYEGCQGIPQGTYAVMLE